MAMEELCRRKGREASGGCNGRIGLPFGCREDYWKLRRALLSSV